VARVVEESVTADPLQRHCPVAKQAPSSFPQSHVQSASVIPSEIEIYFLDKQTNLVVVNVVVCVVELVEIGREVVEDGVEEIDREVVEDGVEEIDREVVEDGVEEIDWELVVVEEITREVVEVDVELGAGVVGPETWPANSDLIVFSNSNVFRLSKSIAQTMVPRSPLLFK